MSDRMRELIQRVVPEVTAFRRDLHAHPELSRAERETSRKVRERLAKVPGLDVRPPLAGTDVVALLNAASTGPCLAIRADLDALPIEEATGVPHASTVPGVMHACGHDGHTAILLGTTIVLAEMADKLPGPVKFVFQPDEEDIGGAEVLCQRGVLDDPKVDGIVALHGWPAAGLGTIAYTPGPASAANIPVDITIRGKGAHGAYPHRGVDAIVVASQVVNALQTIVSRTVDPLDSVVVTIGRIAAGAARNVVAEQCHMLGTIRYLREEVGPAVRDRVERIVRKVADAHGAEATIEMLPGYPPVFNDASMAELVGDVAGEVVGSEHVIPDLPPSLGVEDFAFYARRVPACIFRLALRPAHRDSFPDLHSPQFDFNDDAIPIGIEMFCRLALRYAQHGSRE